MNHVTIGDGCTIQGSVICSNVQLQERAVLKDCQVRFSLSLSFLYHLQLLSYYYYIALHPRLAQALWSLLATSSKGRSWLRKRNDQWVLVSKQKSQSQIQFCLVLRDYYDQWRFLVAVRREHKATCWDLCEVQESLSCWICFFFLTHFGSAAMAVVCFYDLLCISFKECCSISFYLAV